MATSRALSDEFLTRFKASKSRIESRLADAALTPEAYEGLRTELAHLRGEAADALGYLAAYDERQVELQLTGLERALSEAQAANAPAKKFAFKRRTAAPKTDAVSPTPASTPVAPPPPLPVPVPPPPAPASSLSSLSHTVISLSSLPAPPEPGTGITLSSLQSCLVNLLPPTPALTASERGAATFGSIHARGISRSVLLLPPVEGSVFLERCEGCVVVASARQFRMHRSSDIVLLLHVTSTPIIEDCTAVRVGSYPTSLTEGLPTAASKHLEMQDFGWLQLEPTGQRSPNWSPLPQEEAEAWGVKVLQLAKVTEGGVSEEMLSLRLAR